MRYDILEDYEVPHPNEAPFFTDILKDLQDEDTTIGINGINWYGTLYPYLYQHKDRLVYRFNQHYGLREIGAETVSRWMFLLQDRFDTVAEKYNHAYKMYENETIDLDNITLGYVRKILFSSNSQDSSNSSTSSESNSKFRDTPTSDSSVLNNPTTENNDTGATTGESSATGEKSGDSTETYDYHDDHTMIEVNKLIEKYKSLDEDFIREFNQMFIGIMTVM